MNSDKDVTIPVELQEKKPWISRELTNILLLGIGFMFSMGSYSTCAMSQVSWLARSCKLNVRTPVVKKLFSFSDCDLEQRPGKLAGSAWFSPYSTAVTQY